MVVGRALAPWLRKTQLYHLFAWAGALGPCLILNFINVDLTLDSSQRTGLHSVPLTPSPQVSGISPYCVVWSLGAGDEAGSSSAFFDENFIVVPAIVKTGHCGLLQGFCDPDEVDLMHE